MPTVSVIVPAMNEAQNLSYVLPRIPCGVHEVILVDGHSTDDTIATAQRLMPEIRIVQQQGRGKGAALRTGFAAASGDIIVMLDADGSTAPEEIPAYVRALTDGADFAKGSRFLPGGGTADMPLHRKLGNKTFVYLVRLFFGGQYTDLCYGYNAFWARIVPILELDRDGFEIETEMNIRVLRRGLTVAEVPSFESARVFGVGRLRTIPDGWRVLKTIFRERFQNQLGPVVGLVPPVFLEVGSPVMAARSPRFPIAFDILRGEMAPEIQALAEEHDPLGAPVTGGFQAIELVSSPKFQLEEFGAPVDWLVELMASGVGVGVGVPLEQIRLSLREAILGTAEEAECEQMIEAALCN